MESTFENLPKIIAQLFSKVERIENLLATPKVVPAFPKWVEINGASKITSKTPNALRVQVSLGNLKAVKRGSRLYFDSEYLEKWVSGALVSTEQEA
ncbi:hypothetical protein [Mucilaginibacter sp.]|uniref:hypothetical protein n=1 Tax=Mucilaginibacter sp. TaxID=1882438 RepID=UPI0025F402B0|nr:hypothetical protein [Mucilaginibacter sp.]